MHHPPNFLSKPLQKYINLSSTLSHLKQIHSQLLLSHHHLPQNPHHLLISQLIIALSRRFNSISYAYTIFTQTHQPNTFLNNAMIQSLADTPGYEHRAISLCMQWYVRSFAEKPETRPNKYTFPSLLKAMVAVGCSGMKQVHAFVVKMGCYEDVYVGTSLIDGYGKIGDIKDGKRVFDEMEAKNVVTWNTMISGLAKSGDMVMARELFERMGKGECVSNLFTWTSLVSGYTQNGFFREALDVYERMRGEGVRPNEVTFVSVLTACGNVGALSVGRKVHLHLEDNRDRYALDVFLGSSLIDMYSKCGMVDDALRVFESMNCRNVVVYTAMIVGLAMNGKGVEAIEIFETMKVEGMLPNEVTFVGVLCACCHTGLVDKGEVYFKSMIGDYSIVPKLQHYACMVDLYSRAGYIVRAYEFIKEMPIKPDGVVWGALLGACRTRKDFKLGVLAANQILELEPLNSGAFVFLSSASARIGDWDGLEKVKQMMRSSGMKRVAGKSWIEVNNVVHQFFVGDQSHPQNETIYSKLDELSKLLEAEGCKPNVDSVVSD